MSDTRGELLACPFCGEKRIFLNEPSQFYRYGSINCPACMVILPGAMRDQSELIRCWNTRAVSVDDGAREALANELERLWTLDRYSGAQIAFTTYVGENFQTILAALRSPAPVADVAGGVGVAKRDSWPNGCHDPDSCARHFACMYVQCPRHSNDGNDVAEQIRAALASSGGGR